MRKLYLAALLLCMTCMVNTTFAQPNILNPNDPDVIFTSSNQPALPTWGQMSKWGHTNRLSWNPYSYGYKSYYFKGMAFRLKFPKTYQHNVADGKNYPAILFLHGLGEPGPVYDNEFHLVHGGEYHAQKINDGTFDGFMIYPQSQAGYLQSYFPVMKDLMDSLVKYVKLDIDRVHVGGLSSGGQAVWDFAQQQQYAKIACALEPISAAQYEDVSYFASHISIPIFVANGGQDVAPYPSSVTDIINSYKNLGGSIIQGYYEDQGHGAWNSFWTDARYWPFINGQHKANPLVYFQHDEFCPNEAVNAKLGLQAGFYAYEWSKDGITVAGATTNILNVNTYGTYRARFKRTASSAWSAWSPNPAVISQNQGTVSPNITINGLWSNVLPSPDGRTTVPLMVPANYHTYEWRRVSDNALVSSASTYNAPVGQYRIKVTEQFGCGSDFSSVYTVTAANGTNLPDAASSVSAIAMSNSSIQLDWNDNPSPAYNETGFEVYRSTTAGTGYKLIAITAADILSYLDQGLAANTKYFYLIRAINNNGASPVSSEVNAVTLFDVNAPSAPANLVATTTTRSSVSLKWDASTDDVGVTKYEVYVNGVKKYVSTGTTFTVNGLTALTTYSFFIKALDAKGNASPPSNQISATAALRGLNYKYYEGSWDVLPDFANLTSLANGISPNVDITPRLRNDDFGFLWEGYIKIPANGTYTFETYSDDGSKLYIGDYGHALTALVNNDGLHGSQYASGSRVLTAGIHKIAITFFEKGGGEEMKVFWGCPAAGIPNRTQIPNSAFVDDVTIAPSLLPAKPSNLTVTATAYNRVNLSWTDNSSNESAFEISRATSFLGVYSTIGAVAANVTNFVDSINLAPVTKYFYRLKAVNQYGQSEILATQDAAWSMDNNLNDASGNNRNLTSSGSPAYSTDKKEGTHSISFNGSSQYLNVPFSGTAGVFPNDVYTSRTIAVWIKPTAATISGSNKFVYEFGGSDDGIALRFNGSSLQAGIAGANSRATAVASSITSNADWVANGWNHVAVVYDVNRLRLFVNGVLKTTTNLSFSSVPTTTNASRIAGSTGTNAFNSSQTSTNYAGLMDDLEIYDEPLAAAQVLAVMNQSYPAGTTLALPAIPAAPTNLISASQTTTTINLQFNDNSSNETQFELYRSALNINNYRLLATINGGAGATKSYIDSNLFANTNYYYKVRAKGVGGNSAYTPDVLVRTKNNLPQLTNIANFTMRFESQKVINLSATDVDQEAITLTFENPLPSFAVFNSTGNGTGNITFNPSAADLGTYNIAAIATDANNGKDTVNFTLTVNNNYTPVIAAINNVTIGESSTTNVALNATDQDGNAGLTWSVTSAPSFVSITDNGNGAGSLSVAPGFTHAGVYPVTVTVADANGAYESATFTLTVTNVEPPVQRWYMSMKYNSANAPAPWNNIATATTANLKDGSGATTPVGITFVGTNWNAGDAGAVTGNNSGVYPDAVIKDYFWFGVYGAPETINVNLTGLTAGQQYNVTLFGSSAWTGLGNNGTTIYTINGVQKPLYVHNNNQNTVTFASIVPNASGVITVNMAKGAATPYGIVNAIVIEKPFNDGTAPAAPTSLTGVALPDGTVKLDWNDVAYNESSYRVSRATNVAGPFTVLNPGASNANTSSYIDNTVLSSTTYFYKIEAVNAVGASAFSNVAEVSTTNKAPLLAVLADVYVKATNNNVVNIAATDDAGDVMTVSVTNLPSFAVYQNTGNGAGNITFTPSINDIGIYNGITVKVTDNSGASVTRVFNVNVSDNSVRSAYLNFGPEGATPQAAPWNNFLGYPFANTVYNNIKDDANVVTGFTFRFLTQWNGGLSLGLRTGDNSGVFPDNVLRTSFHNYNSGNHTIQFAGLNPAKRYSIGFLTNRNSGAVSNVTFTSGAQTQTIDGSYNTTRLVNLNGLVPNASGVIDVVISKAAANTILLLNAVVIREYNAADPVIRPADLFAETVLTTNSVKLTWSDRSSDETAFQVWRSTSFNGTYTQVGSNLAANTTTYTDATAAANTRYFYKVRAVRSATFSTYSNVDDAIVAAGIVLINQNVNAAQNAASPWNNTASPSTPGATFSNLINTTLVNTGFEMVITKEFNGAGYAGVNANGVFPANVQVSNYWTDAGQTSQVKFQNLDISRKYRIGCFGSNLNNDYATANYTANGKTVELNSYYNSTKVVYLDRLIPGENGELIVSVNTAGGSPYSFTGAFTIEYFDDATASEPVVNTIYPDGLPAGQARIAARSLPAPATAEAAKDVKPAVVAAAQADASVINIYPNPFIDVIKVDMTSTKPAAVNITVHDMAGKMVFRSNSMNIMKGNNVISAHLPVGLKVLPGSYVVNIWIDGKMSKVVKLVKVN
ncbi:MAG: T9SS type A sorting domain-containing protein [Sphingobacteriales bacterium]|nr:MAG: T9SS type A sorting domain-containing protein [Sphingobacteriales bacterium]